MRSATVFCLLLVLHPDRLDSVPSCQELASSLQSRERRVFSQNGEDGITLRLLELLGVTGKLSVEFGVEDGSECNTRILRDHSLNFTTLAWDGAYERPDINLYREFITHVNIVDLFKKYNVPRTFDLLSIDVDSIDWWVLLQIFRADYKPRIIIVEVNPTLGLDGDEYTHAQFARINDIPLVVDHPFSTQFAEEVEEKEEVGESKKFLFYDWSKWSGTNYFGANPAAFRKLGHQYGYEMVYCERAGVNCFLVERAALTAVCSFGSPPILPTTDDSHTNSSTSNVNSTSQGLLITTVNDDVSESLKSNDIDISSDTEEVIVGHLPLPFIPVPVYGPRRMGHGRDPNHYKPVLVSDELLIEATGTPSAVREGMIHAAQVERYRIEPLYARISVSAVIEEEVDSGGTTADTPLTTDVPATTQHHRLLRLADILGTN